LAQKVFHYAKDSKKATSRALGTLVEIITFYILKDWGFESSTQIEKGLIEYRNDAISHNVEYTPHPIIESVALFIENKPPITAKKILNTLNKKTFFAGNKKNLAKSYTQVASIKKKGWISPDLIDMRKSLFNYSKYKELA